MQTEIEDTTHSKTKPFHLADDGATAIEFAFVALPFFLLIFTILELCLIFLVQVVLDHAIDETKRNVLIGNAQNNSWTVTDFSDEVCSRSLGLIDCSKLVVKTDTASLCSQITLPITFTSFGGKDDCLLIRTEYDWPLFVPSFTNVLSGSNGNTYTILVHTVVINEPYS